MSFSTNDQFEELLKIVRIVSDLRAAASLLEWDQETYMPEGGTEARSRQVSTLYSTAHDIFIRDRTGELLEQLHEINGNPMGFQGSLIRVTQQDYSRACKLSPKLVGKIAATISRAKSAWVKARSENDFGAFSDHLQSVVDLSIQKAESIGFSDHRYDALLDEYEPGATSAQINSVFDELRRSLIPIVQSIAQDSVPEYNFMNDGYDGDIQWDLGMEILQDVGFDFQRGRLDISAHPFSTSFSINDVRLTTRIHERNLVSGLFSSLHEAGHGMYEQGISPDLDGTFLSQGTSLGIHESQSRLWENQVGRSLPFWEYYYPNFQQRFENQLGNIPLKTFYKAINRVNPTPVRVDADEVTYNLHIMLRYEIEMMLIEGELPLNELPSLWVDKMRDYLGIEPKSDTEGVLQDIHWAIGAIGYFPTYALGNLISAQIFSCARDAMIGLDDQIRMGNFTPLRQWLQTNIYNWGRKLSAAEIIDRLTNEKMSAEPWLRYIREKYSAIYP